jgi:hypothetical protein
MSFSLGFKKSAALRSTRYIKCGSDPLQDKEHSGERDVVYFSEWHPDLQRFRTASIGHLQTANSDTHCMQPDHNMFPKQTELIQEWSVKHVLELSNSANIFGQHLTMEQFRARVSGADEEAENVEATASAASAGATDVTGPNIMTPKACGVIEPFVPKANHANVRLVSASSSCVSAGVATASGDAGGRKLRQQGLTMR